LSEEKMGDQDNSREPAPKNGARKHANGRDCDTLLPVQYYDTVAGGHSPSGEFKLFFAILEDAVRCYVKAKHCRSGARRAEYIAARAWFYARGAPHVFSFESVCAFLDLNAECLRARLESLSPSDLPVKQFHSRRRQLAHPALSHPRRCVRRLTVSESMLGEPPAQSRSEAPVGEAGDRSQSENSVQSEN
jgi:hypothetical protein